VQSLLRRLPAVHRLLESEPLVSAAGRHGRAPVADACRRALDGLRRRVAAGEVGADDLSSASSDIVTEVLERLETAAAGAYLPVVNATGVLIHTNLGRSPLPPALPLSLGGYLALEYDLEAGGRGQRLAPLEHHLAQLFGAESAMMVNNNAAAVLLLLASHAAGREVVVSRGELIEIGGSFRLPDVMAASGARLVEVGCTNRTHLRDYDDAIGVDTGALLTAHRSNFRIVGFTTSPGIPELAELAHARGLPLLVDQGCGAIHDLRRWGLDHETTVAELLAGGADAVCFSGDKLLGGPQAGIVVGRRQWVEPLGRHPLYRALRPDKSALVWMDRTLAAHRAGHLDEIPLYAMLETSMEQLRRRASRIGRRLREHGVPARGLATRATLGGGTTPDQTMSSYGLGVPGGQQLTSRLRAGRPPVIGRIEEDTVLLDLRTVLPRQDRDLEAAVVEAYRSRDDQSDGGT